MSNKNLQTLETLETVSKDAISQVLTGIFNIAKAGGGIARQSPKIAESIVTDLSGIGEDTTETAVAAVKGATGIVGTAISGVVGIGGTVVGNMFNAGKDMISSVIPNAKDEEDEEDEVCVAPQQSTANIMLHESQL